MHDFLTVILWYSLILRKRESLQMSEINH